MTREEDRQGSNVIELLQHEPEIVAWLEDYRSGPDEAPDDDAPAAA